MSARKPGARPRRKAARGPFSVLTKALGTLDSGHRIDAGGLAGSGRAWLVAKLLLEEKVDGPVLAVCPDEQSADRLAADIAFFLEAQGRPDEATFAESGGAVRSEGQASPPRPRASSNGSKAREGSAPPSAENREATRDDDGEADIDHGVLRLPAEETLPYEDGAADRGTLLARLGALDTLRRGDVRVLVVSAHSLCRKLPPPAVSDAHGFTLRMNELVERDELASRLSAAGYQNAPLVEDPGAFSVRGGIVDLWSPRHDHPVRIELFGDEIDSIRSFDPETQRTVEALDSTDVGPAEQTLFSEETKRRAIVKVRQLAGDLGLPTRSVRGVVDQIERGQPGLGMERYLPAFFEGGLVPLSEWLEGFELVVVSDPLECDTTILETHACSRAAFEEAKGRGEAVFPPEELLLDPDETFESVDEMRRLDLHDLLIDEREEVAVRFEQKPVRDAARGALLHSEGGSLAPLVRRIEEWRKKRRTIAMVASSPGSADRLRRLLEERDVAVHSATGPLDLADPSTLGHRMVELHLLVGGLQEGFEDPETRLVLITEADIFGARRGKRHRRSRARRTEDALAQSFQDLSEGDLVVHVEHGIGRYRGLTRLDVRGVAGDFLLIEYAGRDKIYLPVHRLGQVQRYAGADAEGVRLDRLGSQSFALRKKKVKEELLKMAAELLDIYAARKAHPGTSFSAPDAMFREFEAGFPFEETEDQETAIEEVLSDMQLPEPMDRLVCGDVGYGKTEVAMRAAMKAVLDGRQVVVLVPTTVLTAQHEASFKQRFDGYPVIIEAVSRFLPPAKTREILGRFAEGKVDVLIGTHRLLSRDLDPSDLGLLIIDEEQRFGVTQKERLKKLRRQVDVLTMTATPIPRTLHMSLSGIRDLSIIATPPPDRRSIRTFISRFEGQTIREAAQREIARGGQVFFVHNRVRSIGAMASYLERVLPEARIVVAHGQMSERALEKAMSVFLRREADVLLSTAIIESGLDMPSVNTIIINRSDTFGLAQLYQLRGRVGRSSERAYCYMLVPARRQVTGNARKRLAAIQQLTELGSGLRLATHDLEIRGAGSLLGKEQSGQVAAVGFDLYTELLDEAVRELKGEPPREHLDPEVNLPVSAFLPDDYVTDVHQRLILYKRIAKAGDREALEELRAEIIDRYGRLPEEAESMLRVRGLAQSLERIGYAALDGGPRRLVLIPAPSPRMQPTRAAELLEHLTVERPAGKGARLVQRLPVELCGHRLLEEAEETLASLSLLLEDQPGGTGEDGAMKKRKARGRKAVTARPREGGTTSASKES